MYKILRTLTLVFTTLLAANLHAEQLRSVEDFLAQAFSQTNAEAKKETLWLNGELKQDIYKQLDYTLPQLRLRYWGNDQRTAWILEEIGKEELITMGIVVSEGKVDFVDILAYRESRGYEVKYDFFKDQFKGATLIRSGRKPKLDQNIDGITGATLSVRAVTKVAKLALFLHALTPYSGDGQAK